MWEKIKEKIAEHIVVLVLSLVASLCLIIWRAVPSETWERVGAAIPKRVLGALLALLLIALATALAYIFSLRKQLKSSSSKPSLPPPEYVAACGVLWDVALEPYCPACKTPLRPHFGGRNELGLLCPKCGVWYLLKNDSGQSIGIDGARSKAHQTRYFLENR